MESFPGGGPLAGIPIRVLDPQGRAAIGSTGDDGRFEIAGVAEGWQRVQARPDAGFLPAWYPDTYGFCGAERQRVAEGAPWEGIVFRLPEGGGLEGRVTDGDGAPIEGATVTARGLDFYNQDLARTATTDADGRYRLDGLDSISIDGVPVDGQYRLSAARPGGASWYWPGTWTAGAAEPVAAARGEVREADLAFPEGASLEGRVLDGDGPRAGVVVRAVHGGGGTAVSATTGADGRYVLAGIEADAASVLATAPGFAPTFLPSRPADGEEVALTAGAVAAAPDLVLLGGATLRVLVGGPEAPMRLTISRAEGGAWLDAATLEGPADLTFVDLPPGDARIELRALDAFGPAPRPAEAVALAAGALVERSIEAAVGAAVVGRVEGRGARALTGAVVEAVDPTSGDVLATARSADGAFALGPLAPGPLLLRAAWTPYCAADPAWVEVWAPAGRRPEDGELIAPAAGDVLDVGVLALPPDGDADGMDDVWELAWHLDPLQPDGDEDPDGDGVDNRGEYRAGTDPRGASAGANCAGGGLPILLALAWRRRRSTACGSLVASAAPRSGARRP